MSWTALRTLLLQTLLVACAVTVAVLAAMPCLTVAGLSLCGIQAVLVTRNCQAGKVGFVFAGICLLAVTGSLLLSRPFLDIWGGYFSGPAWLMAVATLLPVRVIGGARAKNRCRILTLAWAFLAAAIMLVAGYAQNRPRPFYAALMITVGLLLLCKLWFRLRPVGTQIVNILILLIAGLPAVDAIRRAEPTWTAAVDPREHYFSYESWKKDPAAFARWWDYFRVQAYSMSAAFYLHDLRPGVLLPFRLKPDSRGMLFQSRVNINHLGFRGPEIAADKDSAYRIVVLGESTTFGITMLPEDKPWPELLGQMIQQRLKPSRPVEVINAGVPGYHLAFSLTRLPGDILPLHPDMVISYHGYNGFFLLSSNLPPILGSQPVEYAERPSRLLGDCEYRLRLMAFKHRQLADLARQPPDFSRPMESRYAEGYRLLIESARTNHFRLVLANYSMAVNAQSDPRIVEFYQSTFPSVQWQIQANAAHSLIVRHLAEQHPEVCFVDTHPHLDGSHDKFVDVMHFTQEGRQQLAENIFAGISNVLSVDLVATGAATRAVDP